MNFGNVILVEELAIVSWLRSSIHHLKMNRMELLMIYNEIVQSIVELAE
jgi:hypothetical protein